MTPWKRIFAAAIVCGADLACAGYLRAGSLRLAGIRLSMATLSSLSAAPGSISFQANNPDSGTVSGSSPGSITWTVLSGSHLQNFSLTLQAGSTTFVGCPTIPISAIRVSCGSAMVSGGGGSGSCGSSFPLSTTAQQIASGTQGDGNNSYTVSLNFTLAESWRYVANSSCTITVTYSVNAP